MIVSLLTIAQFLSKSDEKYDPGGKEPLQILSQHVIWRKKYISNLHMNMIPHIEHHG